MGLHQTLHFAGRVANRLKRELILREPLRGVVERRHEAAVAAHVPRLPALSAQAATLVAELQTRRVVQRHVAALGVPGTDVALASLEALCTELGGRPAAGAHTLRIDTRGILAHAETWHWGLDEGLLDLVENFIGLPVHYHGVDVRREVADGVAHDVRRWHVDPEDCRMVKMIVYLVHGVGAEGGPFEYLDAEATRRARERLRYVSGFVDDHRMLAIVPRREWQRATGPRYTATLADTCAVFHRAAPPTQRDRYTATFSWTSRRARKTYPAMPMSAASYDWLLKDLSPRQRDCVAPRVAP